MSLQMLLVRVPRVCTKLDRRLCIVQCQCTSPSLVGELACLLNKMKNPVIEALVPYPDPEFLGL